MSVSLTINKKSYKVDLKDLPADITLNTFIREYAGLSGTKFMCLEGGCGACICVLKGRHPSSKEYHTWATNSCLTLLNTCNGLDIITIEGIGNKRDGYHPIQKRLANLNGSQCGYCSPAMVMNMYGLMESNQNLTMKQIENSFGGNICRCTGYRPILDAMKSFATDTNINYKELCDDIEDYSNNKKCPKTGEECIGKCKSIKNNDIPYYIKYDIDNMEWYTPKTINELLNIFKEINNKKYILVAGNTAHGVFRRSYDITVFINLNQISELYAHSISNTELVFGGNINLTETMHIFQKASKIQGFEYCAQLYNHFDLIANVPVRNTGTLAGNLMIKNHKIDFPSDVFITLETLNAQITIIDENGQNKTIGLSNFIKTDMTKKLITKITLKPYQNNEYLFNSYKIMPRAQNAHAYINAGFLIQIDNENKVLSARICFGGISPEFIHATETEKYLIGQNLFEDNIIKELFKILNNELKPDWILPDPSPEYRKLLSNGLFYKFLLSKAPANKLNKINMSGKSILERDVSNGVQTFETIEKNYPITKPLPKIESLVQCSGEAYYMNDLPKQPNELWAAFVHTTNVNSKIVNIDATEALAIPGVIAFYSAKDIPGTNSFVNDKLLFLPTPEEIFCSSIVLYYNQPAGVIIAKNGALAEKAAKHVKIMYEKVNNRKIMPTLQDVFEQKGFDRITDMTMDNTNINFVKDDKHIKGYLDIGSQYHFTMEPQTTVCIPNEDGLTVYCAAQWMDLTQLAIAKALNMKQSNVHLEVRRLGGGYGAKISRNGQVACACALACHLLHRPIRFVQTIESMMGCLGKRYACHSDYEINCNNLGKISSLKNIFYEDSGSTLNESPVEGLTLVTARNCYETTDKWNINGKSVITDAPSHTWCRGPGALEGLAMIENIMEHIAFETKRDAADVRLENIPKENKMHELMPEFLKSIDYTKRKNDINEFNKENRWKKKGLGIAIMQYPVDYFGQFPALVSIYHGDGTVCVSHGGIEMGQGLHTKVAQTAAYTLKVPLEMIQVVPSNTITSANSIVTGGGVASENVSYAVKKACEILLERLKPVKESLKDPSYMDIITTAFNKNISLTATSSSAAGELKGYNVWGLGCTEVEVDILTGNLNLTRVDILEDTGESLNPMIDVAQIEGAFVMGLGYWLTELLIFNRQTGELLTDRTWTYKPPGPKDIPIDFRINLLQKSPNPTGFLRSKATGEPSICLSISSVFAIRHALMSARDDAGLEPQWIHLGAPTTPENIVLNSGSTIHMFTL